MSDQLAQASVAGALDLKPWATPVGRSARGARRGVAWGLVRAMLDTLSLGVASVVSGLTAIGALGGWYGAAALLLCLAGFTATGAYAPRLRLQLDAELVRVFTVVAVATLGTCAAAMLLSGRGHVGDTAIVHWLVASTFASAGRIVLFGVQRVLRMHAADGGRTLIIGGGHVGHLAAKRLIEVPELGLVPIGFLDKEPLTHEDDLTLLGMPDLPVFGASWDLEEVVSAHDIDHVVVAFSTAPHQVLLDMVRRCWNLGVTVLVVPRLYEVEGQRMHVERLGALPLVALHTADPLGWQFAIKYAIDRAVAGLALLLLSPVFAAIALAVRIQMGRPFLFRQERVGRDGHAFEMLKFRTMAGAPEVSGEADAVWATRMVSGRHAVEAEHPPLAAAGPSDADRRTPLGTLLRKLSLDELPQLWNVFRGDMSLIGPRPERTHYVEQFEDTVYRYPDRHRVKSGLTGWAQVNGLRGETSLADRIEWDNFYIENWTPWLDVKILAMTVPALLGRRGH